MNQLKNAIEALKLAKESISTNPFNNGCGSELDRDIYAKAYEGLVGLCEKIVRYDEKLNTNEIVPTCDDYNALFSELGFIGINCSIQKYWLDEFDNQKEALANRAFSDYNFGNGVEVTDSNGWEYVTPGNERSRKVYVETKREDDGPAPRWTLTFTVRFNEADGSLQEAYAIDTKGQIWGSMPQKLQDCAGKTLVKEQSESGNNEMYVIYSESESERSGDNAGFWNNEDGWTTLDGATQFSESEINLFSVPVAEPADAKWVIEAQARLLVPVAEFETETDAPR